MAGAGRVIIMEKKALSERDICTQVYHADPSQGGMLTSCCLSGKR